MVQTSLESDIKARKFSDSAIILGPARSVATKNNQTLIYCKRHFLSFVMELAGLKGVVCHHCQQPASHFCSECDQYYCNVAADTHSSRRTSHKMEDLQQVKVH